MAAPNHQDPLSGQRSGQAQAPAGQGTMPGAGLELNRRLAHRWAQEGSAWEIGADGAPHVTSDWVPNGMVQMGQSGAPYNPGGGMGHPQHFDMSDNIVSPERPVVSPNARVMQSPSIENFNQRQR